MKLASSKMPHCGPAGSLRTDTLGKKCAGSKFQESSSDLKPKDQSQSQDRPVMRQLAHHPKDPHPHRLTPQDSREISASRNLLRSSVLSSITEIMKEKHLLRRE